MIYRISSNLINHLFLPYRLAYQISFAPIVGKPRGWRRHVCAIFHASCAILLPMDTQVLFFISLSCEIWRMRRMNRYLVKYRGGQTCFLIVFHAFLLCYFWVWAFCLCYFLYVFQLCLPPWQLLINLQLSTARLGSILGMPRRGNGV